MKDTMPTIHATVTAPTFRAEITKPCITIELPERHMTIQIEDDGTVRIAEHPYDLLDGAPSTPANENTPRYVQGGQYEFTLPGCLEVNKICDTGGISPSDSRFPGEGTFTIAAVHHH
jgi:hypothetical protein